jgi:hypothetical protein
MLSNSVYSGGSTISLKVSSGKDSLSFISLRGNVAAMRSSFLMLINRVEGVINNQYVNN